MREHSRGESLHFDYTKTRPYKLANLCSLISRMKVFVLLLVYCPIVIVERRGNISLVGHVTFNSNEEKKRMKYRQRFPVTCIMSSVTFLPIFSKALPSDMGCACTCPTQLPKSFNSCHPGVRSSVFLERGLRIWSRVQIVR